MRLTLEPTKDITGQFSRPKIIYETPYDDADLDDMYKAFKALLVGWTYSEDQVNEYFKDLTFDN